MNVEWISVHEVEECEMRVGKRMPRRRHEGALAWSRKPPYACNALILALHPIGQYDALRTYGRGRRCAYARIAYIHTVQR